MNDRRRHFFAVPTRTGQGTIWKCGGPGGCSLLPGFGHRDSIIEHIELRIGHMHAVRFHRLLRLPFDFAAGYPVLSSHRPRR